MSAKKGDFVRLKYKEKDVRGHVIDERHDVYRGREVKIEYIGEWIPPRDWHSIDDVEVVRTKNQEQIARYIKCECGVQYDRHGGKHSDYCPLYED